MKPNTKYSTPDCRENSDGEHNFIEDHGGIGIVTRVCMDCGLKEYRYTGATLGMVTGWRFDGWQAIETEDEI
jgi:hypothetical protein